LAARAPEARPTNARTAATAELFTRRIPSSPEV
jgi:hypothetical protein